jgi:hypothetical protein
MPRPPRANEACAIYHALALWSVSRLNLSESQPSRGLAILHSQSQRLSKQSGHDRELGCIALFPMFLSNLQHGMRHDV